MQIVFALMLAIAVAVLFLPVAVFSDPFIRDLVSRINPDMTEFFFLPLFAPEEFHAAASGLLALFWVTVIAICVIPVTIVAMIGELARVRSFAWYACATGLLAGAMPWIVRAARGTLQQPNNMPQQAELRIAFIFCLTGLAAGLVYWLTAGRSTGRRPVDG